MKRQFAWMQVGRVSNRVVAIASVVTATLTRYVLDVAIARGSGAAAYGEYAVVTAIGLTIATVAVVGLPELANRELPLLIQQQRGMAIRRFLQLGFMTSLGAGVLLGAVAAVLLHLLSVTNDAAAGVGLVALSPAAALFMFRRQQSLLVGRPLLGLFAPTMMSGLAATAIVVLSAGFGRGDAVRALITVAASYFVLALLLSSGSATKTTGAEGHVEWAEIKGWLRAGSVVLASNLATLMTSFMDIFLVSLLANRTETGIYAAASRLALLVTLALAGIIPREGPLFGRLIAAGDVTRCRSEFRRACFVSGGMGIVTLLVLVVGGKQILLLFGAGFAEGYTWLCVLVVGRCVSALTGPAAELLIVMGQSRRAAVAAWLGLGVGVLLMITLEPSMGTLGIAVGASTGMVLRNVVQLSLAMRCINFLQRGS